MMKIVAVIPARYGSKRVKQKNLRELDGKPLIQYAIDAAKKSSKVTDVYVNTESDLIGKIAEDSGVKFYKRAQELAEDTVSSDEFNYDFMKSIHADIVVMVNPVAPLITGKDIDQMVDYYLDNDLETLIPVKEERLHTFLGNRAINFTQERGVKTFCDSVPVNFDPNQKLPMTQNIEPIQICSWTVCIWNPKVFIRSYEKYGHGVFAGKLGFFAQNYLKNIKISTEDDFVLAEVMIKNEFRWRISPVEYDSQKENKAGPAMWKTEIKAIENKLLEIASKKDHLNLIEWGSGGSTIHFSNFLRSNGISFKWHSIENYIPWYNKVMKLIIEHGLAETTENHLVNPTCEERKEIQEEMELDDYVNYPQNFNCKFDFMLIDARRRKQCLEIAPKYLSSEGVVALHDAERADCIPLFENFRDGGEYVVTTKSPVPGGVQKLWFGQIIV